MYLDTEEKSIDEDSKYQTTEESTAETEEIEDSQISEPWTIPLIYKVSIGPNLVLKFQFHI